MQKTEQIYCNVCGKEIVQKIGKEMQDYLHVEKKWGYFSKKDGESHSFDLCEQCYDAIIEKFVLEIEKETYTELL